MTPKITIGVDTPQEVELAGYSPISTFRRDGRKHLSVFVDEDGGVEVRTHDSIIAVYPQAANVVKVREIPRG